MTEPIPPEAYLIIAASMNNAVKKYRDKQKAKQEEEASNISAERSKPSMALPADEVLWYAGLKVGNDGYVQWAMDNPAHPRNWSRRRKSYDFGLVLFLELFMSAVSAVGTPVSIDGIQTLGQGREVGLAAFTTTYLLGQAVGVLLLSPHANRVGRRPLYVGSALLYSVFCLPVAATSTIAGVVAGRLLTGVVSAIPALAARRSIEDLFDVEGRMWASFSLALATNLGLVLGPIYASFVAASLNWRWPFYLAAMIVAVTGIPMYFIRESHSSLLLERAIAAIHSHRADLILRTAPRPPHPSISEPLTLLFTNPAILLASLASAFSTALLYLFAVAFPLTYAGPYGWSGQKTTLIFLFLALGLFLSTLTRFHDRRAIRKNRLANPHVHHHHLASGSNSLFGLAIAAPTLAIALWWFAWTIPDSPIITTTTNAATIAWPASAISLIPLGYAINEHSTTFFSPRQVGDDVPIIDAAAAASSSSSKRTSSVTTAHLATRAILSACIPLFTRQMFEHLGAHVAGSVLAAVATALCLFSPVVLTTVISAFVGGRGADNVNEGLYPRSDSGGVEDEKKEYVAALRKGGKTDRITAAGAAKPKKTVRWHDEEEERAEMDSSASTITNNSEAFPSVSLSLSEAETEMEKSDALGTAGRRASSSKEAKEEEEEISKLDDGDDDNARIQPSIEAETKTKDNSRTGDDGGNCSGSCRHGGGHTNDGSNSSSGDRKSHTNTNTKPKKKEEKKEKKKEKKRERDVAGAEVGYCYWGVDLERLAVFPFL